MGHHLRLPIRLTTSSRPQLAGVAVCVLATAGLARLGQATEIPELVCEGSGGISGGSASWAVTPADTLRGLVVLVKFSDELVSTGANDCDSTSWPHEATSIPDWAVDLLEDYGDGSTALPSGWQPEVEGSLTHFYYQMSGGKHILLGETFPTVVEAPYTIGHYDSTYVGYELASGAANADVLDYLRYSAGVDFRRYNYDQFGTSDDHLVDFILFYYREWANTTKTSFMNELNEGSADSTKIGGWARILVSDRAYTYGVDTITLAVRAGATNYANVEPCPGGKRVRNQWQFLAIAAHEYGHHLAALHGIIHAESMGPYGIMDGTYHGHWLMSGFLRYKLGWISPTVYDYSGGDATITLGDAALDGSGGFAIIKTHIGSPGDVPSKSQYFILEGRNRFSTAYTQAQPSSYTADCCKTRPQYSGLLITHIREGGSLQPAWDSAIVPRFDPEVATGMVDSTTAAPNPVRGKDWIAVREDSPNTYAPQDLFVPGIVTDDAPGQLPTVNAFTPYTNPSTDLYRDDGTALQRNQDVYSGISIHNVRTAGPPSDPWSQIKCDLSWDYDGTMPRARGDADTLRVSTTWQGSIVLTADLVVPEGVTLTIARGARVVAATTDRLSGGADPTKPELIIRGTLNVEGTGTYPVEMVSSRNNAWAHYTLPGHFDATGETTASAAGDWYGARFDLVGCRSAAYGYAACAQPLSTIDTTQVENARYGLVLENHCAPSVSGMTFDQITDDRDLFLKSDVLIPGGYSSNGCTSMTPTGPAGRWDLGGGTHVVASTTEFNDFAWGGTDDKVDLMAYAKVITNGSAGDLVYFGPDTVTAISTSGAGADWGGLTITSFASGSKIRWADIGYAENPVFFSYPDSLTLLEDSWVHAFGDVGIWVQGSLGSGAVVNRCKIEREAGLHQDLGSTGIFLDNADEVSVLGTTVDLAGLATAGGGSGIDVAFTKSFCQTTPSGPQSVWIEDTYVLGPGKNVSTGDEYVGVRASWLCGSNDRTIDMIGNWVEGWKRVGMEFVQSADVTVGCNQVVDNNRGVDIYRDAEPTGAAIRFKHNALEALVSDTTLFALRTDDAVKTKLGPRTVSERGENRLKVATSDTKFIFENDPNTGDVLDARDNFWYADTLLADDDPATIAKITARLAPTGYNIDFSGHLDYDDLSVPLPSGCWLTAPTTGTGAMPGRRPITASGIAPPDGADPDGRSEVEVVEALVLGVPAPNPNRAGAALALSVPSHDIGRYVLEVYDVRGRRLWESRQDVRTAGRYRVEWNGRDSSGRQVVNGVYFLRLRGPNGFAETRKVTLLR